MCLSFRETFFEPRSIGVLAELIATPGKTCARLTSAWRRLSAAAASCWLHRCSSDARSSDSSHGDDVAERAGHMAAMAAPDLATAPRTPSSPSLSPQRQRRLPVGGNWPRGQHCRPCLATESRTILSIAVWSYNRRVSTVGSCTVCVPMVPRLRLTPPCFRLNPAHEPSASTHLCCALPLYQAVIGA